MNDRDKYDKLISDFLKRQAKGEPIPPETPYNARKMSVRMPWGCITWIVLTIWALGHLVMKLLGP